MNESTFLISVAIAFPLGSPFDSLALHPELSPTMLEAVLTAPIALQEMVLAVWLIAKGVAESNACFGFAWFRDITPFEHGGDPMKTLTYSIDIAKPRDVVFKTMTDKSVFPLWAKAWGEGMSQEGEWKEGKHIAFFDQTRGGTKVLVEKVVPNEAIETRHVAMVNPQNVEIDLTDDMMRKWIGSQENYYFKNKSQSETTLEVLMIADEAFEEIMDVWPKALQLVKEICEA